MKKNEIEKLEKLRQESIKKFEKREAELLQKNTVAIYQLNQEKDDLLFLSAKALNKKGMYPQYINYELVYLYADSSYNLDNIYSTFNVNRPLDFYGHSLSVSDIIVINDGEDIKAYYVDTFGFSENTESFINELMCKYDPYILKISYSWGEEEPDIFFNSKEDAIKEAMKLMLKEVKTAALEHPESEIGVNIDKENNMYIHYNYDDTYCYYNVVKY